MDSNQSIKWTLATPFVDRPKKIIEFYLEALTRMSLPREDVQLLFIDLSRNPEIHKMLQDYIAKEGSAFATCKIITSDLTTYIPDIDGNGVPDYQARRVAIADTMNLINRYRIGDLILWEDDITPPEDAFLKCQGIFDGSDVYGVTTTQYSRRTCWAYHLMVWDYREVSIYGEDDDCDETTNESVHIGEEKETGVQSVGATATGFILLKGSFLDGYTFNGEHDGQDVQLGQDINDAGGLLLLRWDVKTVHIGPDEEDRITFYRSPMCKTKVFDKENYAY